MIPETAIVNWRNEAPWNAWNQVEQDLIISRAIIEIFNNDFLSNNLAFRGGTALHKLFLSPASRYSEDIDLVQTNKGPVGPIFDGLRKVLSFLGEASKTIRKGDGNKIIFRAVSTMPPVLPLKLKVEMNISEWAPIYGYNELPFSLNTSWFSGSCNITTYSLDELLGTKLRALYQRRKGRDLFDLWSALLLGAVDVERVVEAFRYYTSTPDKSYPSRETFTDNLSRKMNDIDFISDMNALLRPGTVYEPIQAFEIVCNQLINRI